jgi:uncharacterized protein
MSADALRESQLQMARYLRNPEQEEAPAVEERRLKIYRDLIFNNVEGFISGGFPVLRSLYSEDDWVGLVRSFMDVHRCQSPYFLEISQEFIRYLSEEHRPRDCDPPFITELAHYEWVELALDVAEQELPARQALADPANTIVSLSPLAWVLAYQYPVHMIGPGFQPAEAGEPTYLAVYRDRADQVQFMELNAATARLLELHRDNAGQAADSLVAQLAGEMGVDVESIRGFAMEQLQLLLDKSILV